MNLIVAPDPLVPSNVAETIPALFLAGGITDCPDWQSEAIELLADLNVTLYNPRRPDFDVNDPFAAPTQINWEHRALREADAVMFWFCKETVQPITLYELGAWSMTDKPLFVGCDPEYPRQIDVIMQTRLVRPEVIVHSSLSDLCSAVIEGMKYGRTKSGKLLTPELIEELSAKAKRGF